MRQPPTTVPRAGSGVTGARGTPDRPYPLQPMPARPSGVLPAFGLARRRLDRARLADLAAVRVEGADGDVACVRARVEGRLEVAAGDRLAERQQGVGIVAGEQLP